ncbi:MAG: MFS transporter [Chloroflexota bacterium]
MKQRLLPLVTGLIPLFVAAHFAHHLVIALPSPLMPMIRSEFGLDYTQAGFVLSAFGIAYGIAQLPAGWLADRIGPRILLVAGVSGVAVMGILFGLSPVYAGLLICLVLMGIAGGGYHPSTPPLISAAVPPQNRGRALGLHMIGGAAAYFLAPLSGAAIAVFLGWRGPFLVLGIPAFLFGLVLYRTLGRRLPQVKAAPSSETARHKPVKTTDRRLAAFIAMSTSAQAVTGSVVAFMALFIVDAHGVSTGAAAAMVSLTALAGLFAGPVGGWLSDRFGTVPVATVVCLLAGPMIFLLDLSPTVAAVAVVLLAIGTIGHVRMPVTENYLVSSTSDRTRSTWLGVYYFAGMEGSGILTPVVGFMIDRFGFQTSFEVMAAVLMVIVVVCAALLWRRPLTGS